MLEGPSSAKKTKKAKVTADAEIDDDSDDKEYVPNADLKKLDEDEDDSEEDGASVSVHKEYYMTGCMWRSMRCIMN